MGGQSVAGYPQGKDKGYGVCIRRLFGNVFFEGGLFQPCYVDEKFETLSEDDFCELDNLAELLLAPDENFSALKRIWETNRKFRVMNSPLVGERDNLPLLERI